MMNRTLEMCVGTAALLFFFLSAGGCTSVLVDAPVGGTELSVESPEWEGTWGDGRRESVEAGDYLETAVADSGKGILRFTMYENLKMDGEGVVYLRKTGDWTFFNVVPDTGEDTLSEEAGYLWGRVRVRDGVMLLWLPSFPEFKKLVEEGLLPGRIEEQTVLLENLTEEHMKIIMSDRSGSLFDWSEPTVLIRSGDRETREDKNR